MSDIDSTQVQSELKKNVCTYEAEPYEFSIFVGETINGQILNFIDSHISIISHGSS